MVRKEFAFRGKSLEELQKLSIEELAQLLPARQRRTIKRGFSDEEKKLMAKIEKKGTAKTHLRGMMILPNMVGKTIHVHNGKEYLSVIIQEDMIGHSLGEFSITRRSLKHSAPGVGATRSSSAISVR